MPHATAKQNTAAPPAPLNAIGTSSVSVMTTSLSLATSTTADRIWFVIATVLFSQPPKAGDTLFQSRVYVEIVDQNGTVVGIGELSISPVLSTVENSVTAMGLVSVPKTPTTTNVNVLVKARSDQSGATRPGVLGTAAGVLRTFAVGFTL